MWSATFVFFKQCLSGELPVYAHAYCMYNDKIRHNDHDRFLQYNEQKQNETNNNNNNNNRRKTKRIPMWSTTLKSECTARRLYVRYDNNTRSRALTDFQRADSLYFVFLFIYFLFSYSNETTNPYVRASDFHTLLCKCARVRWIRRRRRPRGGQITRVDCGSLPDVTHRSRDRRI